MVAIENSNNFAHMIQLSGTLHIKHSIGATICSNHNVGCSCVNDAFLAQDVHILHTSSAKIPEQGTILQRLIQYDGRERLARDVAFTTSQSEACWDPVLDVQGWRHLQTCCRLYGPQDTVHRINSRKVESEKDVAVHGDLKLLLSVI